MYLSLAVDGERMSDRRPRFEDDALVADVDNRRVRTERAAFAGCPWYDVTAFGADGDGEGDDAPAIQRVVDAARKDGGGTAYLPPGEYRVRGPVELASGVLLRGEHAGATTLRADGAGYAAIEGFGAVDKPLSDLGIADLAIDCSSLGEEGSYSTGEKCIYAQYVRRCRIAGVYAYGAPATGIGTDFMVDSLIHGCVAENNGRFWEPGRIGANGIGVGAGRYDVETITVSDCHALDNGNNGVMFEAQGPEGEDVHSGLMLAAGCTARGNRIGFRDSGDRRVRFVDCSAVDNGESGVVVSNKDDASHGATEHRIADCYLCDNGGDGIRVAGAAEPARLRIADCTVAGNAGRGIAVDVGGPASDVGVADCDVHDNGAHGFYHVGGGRRIRIDGCSVAGNDGDGIRLEARDGAYEGVAVTNADCVHASGGIQRRGLVIDGDHADARIVANAFSGHREGPVSWSERPAVVRGNVGYRTAASGRATLAHGDRIQHGLAEAPTAVLVNAQSSNRAYPTKVGEEAFEIALEGPDGGAVGVAEPVFWHAIAR